MEINPSINSTISTAVSSGLSVIILIIAIAAAAAVIVFAVILAGRKTTHCEYCGYTVKGSQKICPNCGHPVLENYHGASSAGSGSKKTVIIVLIILGCAAGGFLIWYFLIGGFASSAAADARYELSTKIGENVKEIISPMLNENGVFDGDEEVLTAAASEVYGYAQELVQNGEIKGTAYCEEGYSVSFFLDDGSDVVYCPEIQDAYSGGGYFSILSLDSSYNWKEDIYYENAGEIITSELGEFDDYNGEDFTVEELIDYLGSLDSNGTRAVFWRGHGGVYTARNGQTVLCLSLNEKVTKDKEKDYAQYRAEQENGPPLVMVTDETNRYAVTFSFFEKYTSEVNGGLFFCGSCYGMSDGGKLARTLMDKGFDAYVGANNPIHYYYSDSVMAETARILTQKENGMFVEIEDALSRAVEKYEGTVRSALNYKDGWFVLEKDGQFRLIAPTLNLMFSYDETELDPNLISVHLLRTGEDGRTQTYDRMSMAGTDNKQIFVANAYPEWEYEIEISYNNHLIKKVILDLSEMEYQNNYTSATIPIEPLELNILIKDSDGSYINDDSVRIEIFAQDSENGIRGLIQEPEPPENPKTNEYRIILSPGEYSVTITSDDGRKIQEDIFVNEDTTLEFNMDSSSSSDNDSGSDSDSSSGSDFGSAASDKVKEIYAEIVRTYEADYGELDVYVDQYGYINYTGVFMFDLADFDENGVDELVIGYSVPHPEGIEYCTWPALDIWTVEDGKAVILYEGAYVTQSDIGRHCLFTYWNDTYYLVTGWAGSDIELSLLKLENGVFTEDVYLQSDYGTSAGGRFYMNGTEISRDEFNEYDSQIYDCGDVYTGSVYEGESFDILFNKLLFMRDYLGLSS